MIDDNKSKGELSEERTYLAHERTFLANERTFTAWVRTGIALIATGLGIVRFLEVGAPKWIMRILGLMLVITGELCYVFAYWRYNKISKKLAYKSIQGTPVWVLAFLFISLFIMTSVAILVIFTG